MYGGAPMGGGGAHGGGGSSQSLILTGDWPFQTDKCGAHIAELYWQGLVRHDMVIERGKVGRMIGSRGSNLQALRQTTNCEIFVLDKEGAPPGYGDDQRLIIIMGYDAQGRHADKKPARLGAWLALPPAPAAPPPSPSCSSSQPTKPRAAIAAAGRFRAGRASLLHGRE